MTDRRATALLLAAVATGFVLRFAGPTADPAPGLSWSGGILTDPAAVVLSASDAIRSGTWEWGRDALVYPLYNAAAWLAMRLVGPDRIALQLLSALLSTATVLFLALSARRAKGAGAGALTAAVLAISYWLGMFGRVPLVEHLTTALLAAATWVLMRRGSGAAAIGGGLVGVAAFFGKAYAAAFLPAMIGFLAAREGWRPVLAASAALAGVGAAWGAFLYGPHRAEFLQQAARISEAGLEGSGVLAPFTMVSTSWIVHQAPAISILGGLFVLETLLLPAARRRRLADGSALPAFAFAAFWIGVSLLPYRAPRYLIPAVAFLAAAAVLRVVEAAQEAEPSGDDRWPRRLTGALTTALVLGLAAVLPHAASAWEAWTRVTTLETSSVGLALRPWLAPGLRLTLFAAGLGSFVALGRRPRPPGRRVLFALLATSVVVSAGQWGRWIPARTHVLESARIATDAILAPEANVQGVFAPALTLGSRRTANPTFGRGRPDTIEPDATHVVIELPEGEALLRRLSESGAAMPLAGWSPRHRHVGGLSLVAVGPPVTEFERAVALLSARRPAEAAAVLEEHPARDLPEVASAHALALFASGDLEAACRRLEEAVAVDPSAGDLHRLARLADRIGDVELRRSALRRALALDPWDEEARLALREERLRR